MIQRCSECNRSIQGTNCSLHGSVTPVPDLRLKLIIDDGTGAITAILNKEISETLLNKPFIELQKIAEKEGEQTLIEDINTKIFGHQLKLRGNVLSDDFGLTLIAQNVSINETSIEDYYNTISHNLEGFQ